MISTLLSIVGLLCAHQGEALNLTVTPAHREIRVEDPLFFKVRIENTGDSTIVFRHPVAAMLATLGVQFRKLGDPTFRSVRPVGAGRDIIVASQHLKRTHVFASHEVILADELTGWGVSPGEYELRVNVTSQTRTYYSQPVTIRVQPIGNEEHAKIQRLQQLLPGRIRASSLGSAAPSPEVVALEELLSSCVLKETLRWSRKWSEIMRDDGLSDQQRTDALEALSDSLDDVTAEAFICITARHYMTTQRWVSALREIAKLPEPTYQANSMRREVLHRLENLKWSNENRIQSQKRAQNRG